MNVQSLKASCGVRNVVVACVLGAVTGTACLQQCLAQQSAYQSLIFADPLKQIRWISGPLKVSDGDANVNIPNGYRFADATGAHVILLNANAPIPNDLIGVLADNAGTWYAVLEYDKNGYVKSADLEQIDSAAVLKAVQKQLKKDTASGKTALTWQTAPTFDAQNHSVNWAVRVQAGTTKTLNEGVALLGRHGVLEVTSTSAYPMAAAPNLDQIVAQDISFRDGERYSDYQNSDKVGSLELAGLIAGAKDQNTTAVATSGWVYWVYSGLAVCVGFAGFMVMASRKKNRRHRTVRTPASAPVTAKAVPTAQAVPAAQAAPVAAIAATKAAAPVALTNVKLNGNGHGNGNGIGHSHSNGSNGNGKQFHRNRRKRMFDYPKFYTHVMKELSFHAYEGGTVMLNGKTRNGNMNGNGNGNGHTNGANGANGHGNGTNGTNGSESNGSIKTGIEELIATQKALIQEQKCLLEQQTRLIEEKRWLIDEQTAFLKGQAEQFPLKFE